MPERIIPDFYPPRESLAWYHGAWGFMRLFVHAAGTARFELSPEDAARLHAASRNAALLCPNHPTRAEGPLMYLVGHRLNLRYTHCAALEIYGKLGPLGPHLFPGIGCFSIRRRTVDLPAYSAARTLIAGRRNVVLFPEGEISGMSDRLLPFERGAVQIAFWGLEDLQARDPSQPLYLVPIAIKYRETGNAERAVQESLGRLETALALPPQPGRGGVGRLQRIEDAYLASVETELGIGANGTAGNARWDRVLQALAARTSAGLGVALPRADLTRPQRAREMLNAWDAAWYAHGAKGPRRKSAEETRLRTLHRDVARLNRFMSFEEDYVASWPSVERFGDVLRRLEEEVLGRHGFRNRRIARLRVGEPINIAPLRNAYRADRKGTVAAVTGDLETRIQTLLGELIHELSVPWPGAYDTDLAPTPRVDAEPNPPSTRRKRQAV